MPHSESENGLAANGHAHPRKGVYLLTHPRSASNLFQKMMEKQPGVQGSGYHFFQAAFPALMQIDQGSLSGRDEAGREAIFGPYQEAYEKLKDELASAKANGKEVFVKEHACILTGPDVLFASVYDDDKGLSPFLLAPGEKHTNPTYVPDDFLLAMQPIFQIRHPVLMFPSLLRAQLKVFSPCHPGDPRFVALLTLRYSRALYDWYVNNTDAMAPKVIDADDIMNDRSAVRQLCCETGLDADAVQYEWETTEEKDFVMATFKSTLNASKGIKPGLEARSLNIEEEKVKWAAEFGEKDAEDLAKFVYEAMPDYEYLLERRVRGDQK